MISAPSCLYFSAHRKQSNFPTHGVHPVLITSSTHFSWYTYTYTHTCIKSECRGSLLCLLRGSEIFYAAVDQIHFKSGFDINIVGQVQVLALTESWFLVGLDYNTALQPLLITHRTSNIRRWRTCFVKYEHRHPCKRCQWRTRHKLYGHMHVHAHTIYMHTVHTLSVLGRTGEGKCMSVKRLRVTSSL